MNVSTLAHSVGPHYEEQLSHSIAFADLKEHTVLDSRTLYRNSVKEVS